ncbi:MAG: hypothetical protein HY019_15570 [Aquabacterium sp.]|jgi:TolA-binding protein|uniref:hypothetical protein n=1 Tax=Aquabacterium sp. TaxID=1872578 RepID=UPI0025C1F5DA|nr:hypothetical protein [Aquabacterium sp.]MBI3383423.1 hypothetical protein [Aquabacterium sp.]
MKPSIPAISLISLAALTLSSPILAQPAKATDKSADKAAVAPKVTPPNPAEFDKQMSQIQTHMQQMQAQMDKIRQTQDPQERQRLLQDHWNSMQAAMSTMDGMWGPNGCFGGAGMMGGGMGMMGGGHMMMGGNMMGWDHMRGYYSGLTPEQMKQRQYMMDRYMPMQQMMMDHMLWHQRWQSTPPAAPETK